MCGAEWILIIVSDACINISALWCIFSLSAILSLHINAIHFISYTKHATHTHSTGCQKISCCIALWMAPIFLPLFENNGGNFWTFSIETCWWLKRFRQFDKLCYTLYYYYYKHRQKMLFCINTKTIIIASAFGGAVFYLNEKPPNTLHCIF